MAEVVDDAISISGLGRETEEITVLSDLEDVETTIDRHRVIQIVVNLLANAREALLDSTRADKRIWVTVRKLDDGVLISVRDNGPGVPAADRERIFSMGFTTKPDGHGFGLHASFNAATEMGGELRLSSSCGPKPTAERRESPTSGRICPLSLAARGRSSENVSKSSSVSRSGPLVR